MQIIKVKILSGEVFSSYRPETKVVSAIGNFDGLHIGHQKLIIAAKKEAMKRKLPLSVITFEPHPRDFFSKSNTNFMLVDKIEKYRLIEHLNVDLLFVVKFNKELRNLEPKKFVNYILKEAINVDCILAGDNFKFGKDRLGTFADKKIFDNNSIVSKSIKLKKNLKTISISSQSIRNSLLNLDFDSVKESLGRNWSITGEVKKGDQNGRKIGFPTANLEIQKIIEPKFGVYLTKTTIMSKDGKVFNSYSMPSITNFGIRPTLDGTKKLIETHIINFSKFYDNNEIYGKRIYIEFLSYLRKEKKFNSIDQLKNQIQRDVKKAKIYHENNE